MSFRRDLERWVIRELLRVKSPRFLVALLRILRGHMGKLLRDVERSGLPADPREAFPARREGGGFPDSLRGLICVPISDTCPYGYLPDKSCASTWDICDVGNPPKVHGIAQAAADGILADALLGNNLPHDDNFYQRVDWISTNVGTNEEPDYIVLSWRSFAARYASLPPEAPVLYYRRDEICGLPSFVSSLTFLGAAVAKISGDWYLFAAVMNRVADQKIISGAENWLETWMAIPHWCSGETQPGSYHGHYPIHFYARTWNPTGYANDDAYHATTNPEGWRDIGAIECMDYTPTVYRRAYERPRPLGGVFFQAQSNASETKIQACWACVDEWSDAASPLATDVFHITGYQVAEVDLSGVTEIYSVENSDVGKQTDVSAGQCTLSEDEDTQFDCDFTGPSNPHPEWSCANPNIRTKTATMQNQSHAENSDQPIYPDAVIAVDWDMANVLVKAKIVHSLAVDGSQEIRFRNATEITTLEYWCDSPGDPIDAVGDIDDQSSSDGTTAYVGNFQSWLFVVTGGKGFQLPYRSYKDGFEQIRRQNFNLYRTTGTLVWCTSFDPPKNAEPTICPVGVNINQNETYTQSLLTHNDGVKATWLYDLDLRFGNCAWVEGEVSNWTGTLDVRSDPGGGGNRKVWDVSEAGDRLRVGIVDNGKVIELASGFNGTESSTLTIDQPWMGDGFRQTPFCSAGGSITETESTDVARILADRTGLDGFFDIDGYKSNGSWVLESVRTDYGASDEHGNYLTSFPADIESYGIYGYDVVITASSVGIEDHYSHLSNKDALAYFDISEETDARLFFIGLI